MVAGELAASSGEAERERERERARERGRERERGRKKDRQTDRQTERQRPGVGFDREGEGEEQREGTRLYPRVKAISWQALVYISGSAQVRLIFLLRNCGS